MVAVAADLVSFQRALYVGLCTSLGALILCSLFTRKKQVYQLLLFPVTLTYLLIFVAYSTFNYTIIVYEYAPIIVYILFVLAMMFAGAFRKRVLKRIYEMHDADRRLLYTTAKEAFSVGRIVQNAFTLYLFFVILYLLTPIEGDSNFTRILYHHVPIAICFVVIVCEQFRMELFGKQLKSEVWLPVLDKGGRVTGRIPYSIAISHKKYYHPVVRIAVVYKGLLYVCPRSKNAPVSPLMLDYPFCRYVLFHHSIESVVFELTHELSECFDLHPRLLLRYTFENNELRQLVSLYALTLHTDEEMNYFKGGKWWTSMQIATDLHADIFSEYFVKEFLYLQNTVLLAETFS
ncbi:MAG: hypothetical protein LBL81_02120 [Tannerella sp.]|nr:hypothetical protein [Tannerella sp.]